MFSSRVAFFSEQTPPPPPAQPLVMVFNIPNTSAQARVVVGSPYDGYIDWGDGNTTTFSNNDPFNRTVALHTYATAGIKTVSLYGNITILGPDSIDPYDQPNDYIEAITSWGDVKPTTFRALFYNSLNVTEIAPPPTTITDMGAALQYCGLNSFTANIANWDVGNVTSMFTMFAYSGINPDITSWNVSNVTEMTSMFVYNTTFNQNIGSWNTANATNMNEMFAGATAFNQDIGSWNTANATNMTGMFSGAEAFNQDLTGWCVTNITEEPFNFATGSALTSNNYPIWGTCP